MTTERKERRGFASMSAQEHSRIARLGGKAAHKKDEDGNCAAHEWTVDEARLAGRKGGQVSRGGRGRLVPTPPPVEPTDGEDWQHM